MVRTSVSSAQDQREVFSLTGHIRGGACFQQHFCFDDTVITTTASSAGSFRVLDYMSSNIWCTCTAYGWVCWLSGIFRRDSMAREGLAHSVRRIYLSPSWFRFVSCQLVHGSPKGFLKAGGEGSSKPVEGVRLAGSKDGGRDWRDSNARASFFISITQAGVVLIFVLLVCPLLLSTVYTLYLPRYLGRIHGDLAFLQLYIGASELCMSMDGEGVLYPRPAVILLALLVVRGMGTNSERIS